eukprot:TRINITY_DN1483_c0_g5_i1.p2 TRINITY_DN1483_c0_g5~~TRINITY_DN1483_c0_g5_i1.p2  ORF type:complete len:179 (-),score=19.31 TRINITY_DN1483_c0_g5_i1:34-570(-)
MLAKRHKLNVIYTNALSRTRKRPLALLFNAKRVSIDGRKCTLGIWDTAGSERYEAMSRIYYRAAKAALICFDGQSEASFERALSWLRELKEQEPGCRLYLVACKSDLVATAANPVSMDRVRQIGDSEGARIHVTSAKTGEGVDELFCKVAEDWLNAGAEDAPDSLKLNPQPGQSQCPC